MKVSELTDGALDYWVGRCNGDDKEYLLSEVGHECLVRTGAITAERYSPSTNWAQGGPIIERERITLGDHGEQDAALWVAAKNGPTHINSFQSYYIGQTPLIAAMRCFVASSFGDAVDDS